jgi:integrase
MKGPHVRERRQILCGLAQPARRPHPQILHQPPRGHHLRIRPKGHCPPKKEGAGTIGPLLCAYLHGQNTANPIRAVSKALIAEAGHLFPHQLTAPLVLELDEQIYRGPYAYQTKAEKAYALRRLLRWLQNEHRAPNLEQHVRRYPDVRPRNVTVTPAEIDALMTAAPPYLRLWLLLCSDLAIRSGTAASLGPAHYDRINRTLRFTTKHNAKLTLPVTAEIRVLIDRCDLHLDEPFVRQLWRNGPQHKGRPLKSGCLGTDGLRYHFLKLCQQVGIVRRIIPHDLRRTSAVAMLEHTGDVRKVKALLGHKHLRSTLWYLDHDLTPVDVDTLELIKSPAWRKEKTA